MQVHRSASAIGLYEYGKPHPGNSLFGGFYAVATRLFQSLGIQPTHIGAEGEGYSGKYTKFHGKTQTKLLQSDFGGISVLALAANPSTSDSPAYDSFAMTSLSYVHADRELLLCFVVNEAFVRFRSDRYDAMVSALARLHYWDFGYGFSANAADQPQLHILGMDNGRLSKADQRLLNAWYAAPADVRITRLRDVYPYNLLNEQQLHQEIGGKRCLKDFIVERSGCALTRLTDYGLYQWKIYDDSLLEQLRKQLRGLHILID